MAKRKIELGDAYQKFEQVVNGWDRIRFFDGHTWIEASMAKGGGVEVRGLVPLLIVPHVANNFVVLSRRDWSKS